MNTIILQPFETNGIIYYSAPEIARAFNTSEATIKSYCRSGKINALKLCWSVLKNGHHLFKYIFTLNEAKRFWHQNSSPIPNAENQPRFVELTDDQQAFYFHSDKNFSQQDEIFSNGFKFATPYIRPDARINQPDWPELRRKCFARDKFICQICGSAKNLTAHHVSYENLYKPAEIDDLVTLCSACHRKIHAKDIAEKRNRFRLARTGFEKGVF